MCRGYLELTKFAALAETGGGTGEVEASHFEKRIERIVLGHFDGEAGRMAGLGLHVATPRLGIRLGICFFFFIFNFHFSFLISSFCK